MSAINPISNPLAAWQSGLANRAGSASTPGNVIRVRPIPANPFAGGTGQVQPTDPARPTRDPGQADRARSTSADRPGPRTGSVYQTNADGDSVTLSSKQLSPEEQEEVQKLQTRDREVRTHEEAHKAAAGALYRGGPYYDYQTGPDGQRYAVGGRVAIDTSPAESPEATIAKARKIRASALAPAEPSSTDQRVAAKAAQMEAQAHAELAQSQSGTQSTSPERQRGVSLNTPNTPTNPGTYSPNEPGASATGRAAPSTTRPTLDLVA